MKIPKNFLNTNSATKFREYLKLLPAIKTENTRIITTLIMTFFALAFFGIFAINPTISTIVDLKKQLADNQLVYERLKTKVSNLHNLSEQYNSLALDLPIIETAVPENPQVPILFAQILGLAKEKQIKINSLDVSEIDQDLNTNTLSSLSFTLTTSGSYETLISFAKDLVRVNRIITIESVSLNKSSTAGLLDLNLTGKAYFQ